MSYTYNFHIMWPVRRTYYVMWLLRLRVVRPTHRKSDPKNMEKNDRSPIDETICASWRCDYLFLREMYVFLIDLSYTPNIVKYFDSVSAIEKISCPYRTSLLRVSRITLRSLTVVSHVFKFYYVNWFGSSFIIV